MESRNDQMREQVEKFHMEHPEVWDLFVRFSFDMIRRGYKSYSAYTVMERIRWEKDAGGDGVNSFKINNNHIPFYSRRFMRAYPQYEGFFKTRYQISNDMAATDLPELTPRDYEYTNVRSFSSLVS